MGKTRRILKTWLLLALLMPLASFAGVLEDRKGLPDSSSVSTMIGKPVIKVFQDNETRWVIAGENGEWLFKISATNEVTDIKSKFGIPQSVKFNDLTIINSRRVMAATANSYIYLITPGKATWINANYGLTDSTILSVSCDKKKRLMEVKTPKHSYLVKRPTFIRNLRFVEMKDTSGTFEEISEFLRKNFRWSLQKGICTIASDVDLSFRINKMISDEQLLEIKSHLQSGDIIIKRNDSQLANIGIPGFWTHSGIYLGSLGMIDSTFSSIEMLNGQLPSAYIAENYPEAYLLLKDKSYLIIEAIAKGVVINPLEHIAKVDYLAALRPNLTCEDIFKSLLTALEYLNTPYDYLFDFADDDELVCSELIYHAYSPLFDKNGITFSMGILHGKPFLSPNDMARQFSEEYRKGNEQLSLVFFYDADNGKKRSERRNEAVFAKTWKRN